jgi:hypothetical protein
MNDEGSRRKQAREAIQAGKLPTRDPTRIWGGNGFGSRCVICGDRVNSDERGYELQFARSGAPPTAAEYHLHVGCFVVWEEERRRVARTERAC